MDCNCTKEDVFAGIRTTNEKFDKAINGNGRPGLIQTVTELSIHVSTLNESMPLFKEQISALLEFKATETACKSNKSKTIQAVALWFGLIIALVFNVLNYNISKTTLDTAKGEIYSNQSEKRQSKENKKQETINEMNK